MNIAHPIKDAHTWQVSDVLQKLETDAKKGLGQSEAEKRIAEFGPNAYQAQKQKSLWLILLVQFASPIVYLLVFGAAVSLYFKDYAEAIAIAVVILVNALIGFLMELQARSSMNALRQMEESTCKVIRDGKIQEVPAEKITLGDVVWLEAGDVVPGDGRLIEVNHLQCDESSLTGESLPTEKKLDALPMDTSVGDQFNMVFKGSSVMNGNGKAVITAIAQETQLGTITSLVENAQETSTPLDKKLNALSKKLIWVTLVMTVLYGVSGFIQGKKWVLIIETSIALAVAAIPEGLPIVATVALAYGMLLMARRNAIVKRLSSVETLGSTTVILTDKTGTLTENKIYVEIFAFPDENLQVGIVQSELKFKDKDVEKNKENFEKLKLIGALCNNASIEKRGEEIKETGDPIEIALIHLTHAVGLEFEEVKAQYPRVGEMPFNSDTKIMGTLHKNKDTHFVAAKGSVEHLLEKCTKIQLDDSIEELKEEKRKEVLEESEKMSADGVRVLAFAYREGATLPNDNFAEELIYVAMIGFLDPPRLDIKEAIVSCRKAGIKVVMITGDHPKTALNIAKQTGLVDDSEQNVIIGKDLPDVEGMSKEWQNKVLQTAVFARASPKQKLDVADIYQKEGHIVAMTGDGVNDAPALKKADVGIAMGLRGTQVAKETASIVLKDDSFTSIAEAVAHGREIFQNIQKFVVYLISCNLSEIFVVTILGFIAPNSTLVPLQILFLNMITDVLPALALGVGKGDKTVMQHPPRDTKADILSGKDWWSVSIYSLLMTIAVVAAMFYCKQVLGADDLVANNVVFIALAFAQLFHVFNMSSPKSNVFRNEVTTNTYVWWALVICAGIIAGVYAWEPLGKVLHLTKLSAQVWIVCILASLLPLLAVQVYKAVRK